MTKTQSQPLHIANPFDVRHGEALPPSPRHVTTGTSPTQPHASEAVDTHVRALPPDMRQRLARSLTAKDLANAFSVRVLDKADRFEIFKIRLADVFPNARAVVQELNLDATHDYNKIIAFMETGRWPRGTTPQLAQIYPRLLDKLLSPMEEAWKLQAHQDASELVRAIGTGEINPRLLKVVDHDVQTVCQSIRAAHLEGQRELIIKNANAVRGLPETLGTLHQLRELTVSKMGLHQLPASLGMLKNLEVLKLHSLGSLRALPQSLSQLPKLKKLIIAGDMPRKELLQPALAQLPSLQVIDVDVSEDPRPSWLPEHVAYEQVAPFVSRSSLASDFEG